MPPHGKTKHRVFDERREFLGNYKTVLGKEEALRKATGEDLEEGLVSRPFSESELRTGVSSSSTKFPGR